MNDVKYNFFYDACKVCEFINKNPQYEIIHITHAMHNCSSYFHVFYRENKTNNKENL